MGQTDPESRLYTCCENDPNLSSNNVLKIISQVTKNLLVTPVLGTIRLQNVLWTLDLKSTISVNNSCILLQLVK